MSKLLALRLESVLPLIIMNLMIRIVQNRHILLSETTSSSSYMVEYGDVFC